MKEKRIVLTRLGGQSSTVQLFAVYLANLAAKQRLYAARSRLEKLNHSVKVADSLWKTGNSHADSARITNERGNWLSCRVSRPLIKLTVGAVGAGRLLNFLLCRDIDIDDNWRTGLSRRMELPPRG